MDCKGEPLLGVQGAKPPGLTFLSPRIHHHPAAGPAAAGGDEAVEVFGGFGEGEACELRGEGDAGVFRTG